LVAASFEPNIAQLMVLRHRLALKNEIVRAR
jgi:hypothetical protein